ncbi:MAG: hypothetical protein AB203_01235 [Parcubacteria bacterium C7867-008]|nr:MAG: hypothetical protein AB203_01235 [Parcubacteria bacterium C7867-008]
MKSLDTRFKLASNTQAQGIVCYLAWTKTKSAESRTEPARTCTTGTGRPDVQYRKRLKQYWHLNHAVVHMQPHIAPPCRRSSVIGAQKREDRLHSGDGKPTCLFDPHNNSTSDSFWTDACEGRIEGRCLLDGGLSRTRVE